MMRWLLMVLSASFVASVHSNLCGFNFMETYYQNEAPSDCFYFQACVSKNVFFRTDSSELNNTVLENDYAQDLTSPGANDVLYEAAMCFKANEIVIQFLHRLFSGKSELLKNIAPEWSKQLPEGPYTFRVIESTQSKTMDGKPGIFVVVKVCPDENNLAD